MASQVTMHGRLTADPTVNQTQSGMQVGNFTLAVEDGFGDKKKVAFVPITIFGKRASVCQYLKTGKEILVFGCLRQENWQGKDGKQNSRLGVIANDLHFCGPAPSQQGGGQRPQGVSQGVQQQYNPPQQQVQQPMQQPMQQQQAPQGAMDGNPFASDVPPGGGSENIWG